MTQRLLTVKEMTQGLNIDLSFFIKKETYKKKMSLIKCCNKWLSKESIQAAHLKLSLKLENCNNFTLRKSIIKTTIMKTQVKDIAKLWFAPKSSN